MIEQQACNIQLAVICSRFGQELTKLGLTKRRDSGAHIYKLDYRNFVFHSDIGQGLTKKAEPPPTRDENRASGIRNTGAASANGDWLR